MFTDKMLQLVGVGILETFYMTLSATALAYLIGLPLGLVLVISDPAGIHPMPKLNKVLGAIINFLRAAPFLILLMLLIPFTRLLIGTTIGASAMVPPLFIAAFPFVARMVESCCWARPSPSPPFWATRPWPVSWAAAALAPSPSTTATIAKSMTSWP